MPPHNTYYYRAQRTKEIYARQSTSGVKRATELFPLKYKRSWNTLPNITVLGEPSQHDEGHFGVHCGVSHVRICQLRGM